MAPNCVVKHLDVIEHISLGLFSDVVDPAYIALSLEMFKESLNHSIVVTIAPHTQIRVNSSHPLAKSELEQAQYQIGQAHGLCTNLIAAHHRAHARGCAGEDDVAGGQGPAL